jgi:D-glycero-alpha-D-manno-heptose-7-phosphate kinase
VVRAVEYGNSIGCRTIALTGNNGGKLGPLAQLNIHSGLHHRFCGKSWRNRCRRQQLAAESCVIEIERCGSRIGKQDQYAAAFGGLNFIRFHPDEAVTVEPIRCGQAGLERLQQSMLMFYTGPRRNTDCIPNMVTDGLETDPAKQGAVKQIVALAHVLRDELQKNNIDALGEILHESWMLKKKLAPGITNPQVDGWRLNLSCSHAHKRGGRVAVRQ